MINIDLDKLDVDGLYNLLINYRIPAQVAQRFKEQMIDGYIISKLNAIPTVLIPEIGIQIKFCDLLREITGKTLEYPENYQFPEYSPLRDDTNEVQRQHQLIQQQQQTQLLQNQLQTPLTPSTQQLQVNNDSQRLRILRNENSNKLPIPFPAPLPEFSDYVEHHLRTDNCLKVVFLMNRELVDFYNTNNYDLTNLIYYRNVCQTLLDLYPELNDAVSRIIEVENHVRNRRRPVAAWTYLSKKLSTRRRYVRMMKEREAGRSILIANRNLNTFADAIQNQQYIEQQQQQNIINSTPTVTSTIAPTPQTTTTTLINQPLITPVLNPQLRRITIITHDRLNNFQTQNTINQLVDENNNQIEVDQNNNQVDQLNNNQVDHNNNQIMVDNNNNIIEVDQNNNHVLVDNQNNNQIESDGNNIIHERVETTLANPVQITNNSLTTQDLFQELEELQNKQNQSNNDDDNIVEDYNEEYITDEVDDDNENIESINENQQQEQVVAMNSDFNNKKECIDLNKQIIDSTSSPADQDQTPSVQQVSLDLFTTQSIDY